MDALTSIKEDLKEMKGRMDAQYRAQDTCSSAPGAQLTAPDASPHLPTLQADAPNPTTF